MFKVNQHGAEKAHRFRQHFKLDEGASLGVGAKQYLDVHDYLHTLLGAKPEWGGDEERVVAYEDRLWKGLEPKPRGLTLMEATTV